MSKKLLELYTTPEANYPNRRYYLCEGFDYLPDRIKDGLSDLLQRAYETKTPIVVSQLRPASRHQWLLLEQLIYELRSRRLIYYEYDCKVKTQDMVIQCVSDAPRSDEDYQDLIRRGIVLALECSNARRINCPDNVCVLVRKYMKEHMYSDSDHDGLVMDNGASMILDILYCWNQQGYFVPDRWTPHPGLTTEFFTATQDMNFERWPIEICAAIEEYAKSLASDTNKSSVPEYDLVTFLTMKNADGKYMYEFYCKEPKDERGYREPQGYVCEEENRGLFDWP